MERLLRELVKMASDPLACIVPGEGCEAAVAKINDGLKSMEQRRDCADFVGNMLIRCYHIAKQNGFLDGAILHSIKTTLLEFIYRDFPVGNRMLHRSENHRLVFMALELITAEAFSDDVFAHDGRPAREHFLVARNDIRSWTNWTGTYGFAEWDSPTYYAVNLLGLFNIFDYTRDADMRRRAEWVIDKLLLDMALKYFDGAYSSSHGRCYPHDILTPESSNTYNVLPFFFDKDKLDVSHRHPGSEMCIELVLATTGYRPPKLIGEIFLSKEDMYHRQRNRADRRYFPPPNVPYVKNLNLYGDINLKMYRTSCFALGSLASVERDSPEPMGVQEHAWQATLPGGIPIFTNNPGCEDPNGYKLSFWVGNVHCPTLFQHENILASIYDLKTGRAEGLPITHAHFPTRKLDEFSKKDHCLLGRKGDSYVALMSAKDLRESGKPEYKGLEFHSNAPREGWVCVLGSRNTDGDFEEFCRKVISAKFIFDEDNLRLSFAVGDVEITLGVGKGAFVNGRTQELEDFPHHEGPYAKSEFASGLTELRIGKERETIGLDFGSVARMPR